MGERRKEAFRVGFDRSVKIEFREVHVTSDARMLAFRELDEALGLTGMAAEFLTDTRTGLNTRHRLVNQLRQSVYSRLADYEDTNDAEQLCFQMAEVLITQNLFAAILRRIQRLIQPVPV